MKSQQTNAEITNLLKSRHTLLWIVTREETRVERALIEACGAANYDVRLWDCASGISDATNVSIDPKATAPGAVLEAAKTTTDRMVFVLRDYHKWLEMPVVLRGV